MSVDGVVETPENWAHQYVNEDIARAAQEGMGRTDTLLFGRRTYEQFASYWPKQDPQSDPFAGFLNETRKVVVSSKLRSVEWSVSELLRGDVEEGVAALKRESGGSIGILGSITLVGSLLRAGLLDDLEIMLAPIVVGTGKRLFEGGEQIPLRLVESKEFDNGVLSLRYAREE